MKIGDKVRFLSEVGGGVRQTDKNVGRKQRKNQYMQSTGETGFQPEPFGIKQHNERE